MKTPHDQLTAMLSARQEEIAGYQININNFEAALKVIDEADDASELVDYRELIAGLLADNRKEQRKARVIQQAIKLQMEGTE